MRLQIGSNNSINLSLPAVATVARSVWSAATRTTAKANHIESRDFKIWKSMSQRSYCSWCLESSDTGYITVDEGGRIKIWDTMVSASCLGISAQMTRTGTGIGNARHLSRRQHQLHHPLGKQAICVSLFRRQDSYHRF